MALILYGSRTSPFVRRIRMLLEHVPYEFKEMNIFETQDAELLNRINPVNQIPVLQDGEEHIIWDSRLIFQYLNQLHRFQNFAWEDENLLTAIDGAMNAGVSLLLMKRSGFDIQSEALYIQRQRERIESILNYLKPYLTSTSFENWNFHTMSLYSFLDWAQFREIISLKQRPECLTFLTTHAERPIVQKTAIPKV